MPEFILNNSGAWYNTLDEFTRGYIEAGFFTDWDCDTGDHGERAGFANDLGVSRLTKDSRVAIVRDCKAFQKIAAVELAQAYARGYDHEQAGRDFWFTRQGHGVGFWDREELYRDTLGDELSALAKSMGEVYPDAYRGWIHIR